MPRRRATTLAEHEFRFKVEDNPPVSKPLPKLPQVPPPPLKHPSKIKLPKLSTKPSAKRKTTRRRRAAPTTTIRVRKTPPKSVDEEYIESEIKKIDFFLNNRMLPEAKSSFELLLKGLRSTPGSTALRRKFRYDLRRIKTAIELLEL
ncbi:hypothetical protein DRJ48_01870 [Candidatus Woesearchaeota archaeon]|nr:MAG: hypothetical protein DRJ48_01870 [Candidatus Woesearchaeota archaeon]